TVYVIISDLYCYVGLVVSVAVVACSADKNREKVHVAKRQELKSQQRNALLARRRVETVIEEVDPLMLQTTSRLSCVRELPDLETLEKHRLQMQNINNLEQTQPSKCETLQILEGTQSSGEDDSCPICDHTRLVRVLGEKYPNNLILRDIVVGEKKYAEKISTVRVVEDNEEFQA
ncbi:hypothetical protein DICVIV_14379, partial [Dictyocaulus viviparus]